MIVVIVPFSISLILGKYCVPFDLTSLAFTRGFPYEFIHGIL